MDLISRQAAIDALETVGYDFSESELSEVELEEVCGAVGDVRQDMIGRIKRLPSAGPKRIRGKWIEYEQEFMLEGSLETVQKTVKECSVCTTKIAGMVGIMNFCPNCGADMRQKGENSESN